MEKEGSPFAIANIKAKKYIVRKSSILWLLYQGGELIIDGSQGDQRNHFVSSVITDDGKDFSTLTK